jgi:site-specific DNA recombinase
MIFNNKDIKHVAIYLRLSRDEEGKGVEEVLRNHRETLIKLVKDNKWSYELLEEVASSSTITNRPKMLKLIERIEDGQVDAVVVMDIDRLSRNEYDQSDIKRLLFKTGTLIVTPSRIYDLGSDEDALLIGVTGLVASQEYKMILKRMKRGKIFAQKQGQWTNGIAPLGYSKDTKTKKLVPNERAEDIRFIFNEVVKGATIPVIVEQLTLMGATTRDGKPFRYNSILRLINNECYKGTLISNKTIGKHEGTRPKDEWIVVNNCHEAIVEEDVWEKANQLVNEYSFKAPRSKNRTYPTTRLIHCGQCGKLQGTNYQERLDKIYIKVCGCGNRTHYYNPVLQAIKSEVLTHKDSILEALRGLDEGQVEDNTAFKVDALTKQLQKVQKALQKIDIMFEEDEIDLPTYRERKAKRQEEIKSIEAELEAVRQNNLEDKKKGLEEQLQYIEKLSNKWHLLDGEGLTDEEVNRMLHFLIDKIYWTYEKGSTEPKVDIAYK